MPDESKEIVRLSCENLQLRKMLLEICLEIAHEGRATSAFHRALVYLLPNQQVEIKQIFEQHHLEASLSASETSEEVVNVP